MRTFTPFPRSGLALGIPFIVTATLFAATACNPVAPESDDAPAAPGGKGGVVTPTVSNNAPGGEYGPSSTDGTGVTGGGSVATSGVAAFATCSSPADMKGVSAADFCAQYMSTCQFGAGAAKYTSVDDCKAKYAAYTGEQKWCVAYHLCKSAENNGAGKDTHCPHTAGGGGNPCKLAAAPAADGGAPAAADGGVPAAAPSLKTDIFPLFAAKCQKCHMDLVKAPADLFKWLTDNAGRAACGPLMMPRKAVILSKTNPDPAVMPVCGAKMPGALGDAEIWAKLKAWNAAGAQNN